MEVKDYEINGHQVRFMEEPVPSKDGWRVKKIRSDENYDLLRDKRISNWVEPCIRCGVDDSGKLRSVSLFPSGEDRASPIAARTFIFDENGNLTEQITRNEKFEETVKFNENGQMAECEIKDERGNGYIEQYFDENGDVNRVRHWQWSGNDDWTVDQKFEKENAPQVERVLSEKEEEKVCVVGNYALNMLRQNPELSKETQQIQQVLEAQFKLDNEPTNDITAMMKNIGNTFMEAVVSGRTDIVSALLDAGVSPNIKSENNMDTPLIASIRNGNSAMFSLLSSHGADFHQKNEEGQSPADVAHRKEDKFFIDALKKEENADGLKENLRDLEAKGEVSAPTIPPRGASSYSLAEEYARGNDVSFSVSNAALVKNKGR